MSGRLVLVRHGQSHGNVERRLDTRPPGSGAHRPRSRTGTHVRPASWPYEIGMVAHSVAVRASQTAAEIGGELDVDPHELEGIHEVQVGELEDRNDDAAIEEFNTIYQRWHEGDLDLRDARWRDRHAGARPLRAGDHRNCGCATSTTTRGTGDIVVVSHGAAIRLVAATLAGVDGSFALDHHLANTESVVLAPITDGRWSCLHWGPKAPPFYPEPDVHPVEDALSVRRPDGLSAGCSRSPRSR